MPQNAKSPFVGRLEELNQFEEVLKDPQGQAVIVVGSEGIGKSALLHKMAQCAATHSGLQCGFVGYEITPVKSPNALIEEMLHHAFDAVSLLGQSNGPLNRMTQWNSFFRAFFPLDDKKKELATALRYEPHEDICGQFLERLEYLSTNMPDEARGLLFLDTGIGMKERLDDVWVNVFHDLPPKIKVVFAQRPHKALPVGMERHSALNLSNVIKISLDVLDDAAVMDLVERYGHYLQIPPGDIHKALTLYQGHPYALSAALEMLRDGEKMSRLPDKSSLESVSEAQWRRVGEEYGYDAVRLFEAFAVLDDFVPIDVASEVSTLSSTNIKTLIQRHFLEYLIKKDGEGNQIYHGILRDHILGSMENPDLYKYQKRAVEAYRRRIYSLHGGNELATRNLIKHMLEVTKTNEVIYTFINECTPRLINLGFFQTAIDYTNQLLRLRDSSDKIVEATLKANLGVIYRSQGRLNRAEQMQRNALDINRKIRNLKGMAYVYINLGDIYQMRGKLTYAKSMYFHGLNLSTKLKDVMGVVNACSGLGTIYLEMGDLANAERTFKQALNLNEKLGRLDGMATQYGNLGVIYQKKGEYERARDMYGQSLEIHQELGNLEGIADNLYNLGVMYRQLDDYSNSEEMYNQALEKFEQVGNHKGMADVYVNLAGMKIARVNYRKAKEYINKARELYSRLSLTSMVKKMDDWISSLPDHAG